MPDNKGKKDKTTVKPSIEDSFKELELRNIAGEDFSYLKNQNDNISFESSIGRNSKLNYIGDYGNSKYDESLTDQYFRQYVGSDNLGYQEQRAQNQSSLAKVGAGLGNTVTQAGLDIFKDAGYLLDFENYFDFKKSAEEGFHNWFSDAIQSVEDKLKLPVYRTEDSKGFSPTSAGWWGDNLPSIASSIAMAFPAEAAVAGLGKLGGLIGGEKLIKGLETLSGVTGLADKAKGVGAAIISRQMESLMEGGQTYQDTFNEAMKKPGMTEEQARQIAGEAAANNYKANWAAIVQDIPEYMILHKTFKEANKLFSGAAAKEALKTAALEGSEEAYQYITDKEAKRAALINGKVLKDDNSSLADRLIDYSKDGDLWTSAFFGAIGGAGFGAAGVQNNYKNQQKFDNVLQAHQAILKGDKEGYNRAQDNILNSTIVDKVDNDIKNGSNTQLEQFKQGLEYIKSNPERIKDEDRVETITRLNEAIAQTEYAQTLQQEITNDSSIEPEFKKLTFATRLEQRSIENRLAQVNNKLSALSSKDAVNLGFSADIQAYKAAKLKYEAISQIPALSKEAEELGKNLENVKERIASDENYNFKSFDELDKFILSSNNKELTNLYYNQAKEQANLQDVKDILYANTSPEGKQQLKEKQAQAKVKEQDYNNIINSINKATNEKDLNSLLKEADDKNISTPEIIDQIAKKRQQIINDRAQQDLISKLDPVEDSTIDTPTTIDESNVNTINPIEDGSKKSKHYNKTTNGRDNDTKESVSRAFRYNESLLTGKVNITDKRLKIVTKANNPELYNRILLEDPQNKQFEDNYKKKEGKDYEGLYVVVTDSNNQPILVDNKLVFSTLETAQRVIDGSILPEDKQAAITNLNDLRSSSLVSKDPNAYLQPIATSKGIPQYLPKVGNKRPSIPVIQSFGPIDQLELEVPTLQAGDKPGMAYLSKNKQIALTGKLYVYDKANTAFDLIPRNVNELEADMIINLTYQKLGLIPKTTANPVKEIEKIISALIPKGGANEFTYGFKDNNLYVGNSNIFTLKDLQERPQEIHDFIKSFLTSIKYVNVNINKKNGYELESKFIGPTIDDKQPGKQYNKYKEYLLEGSSPMFGTDLAPSTSVQYRNVYLIYETDENGKPVIKTDNIGQTNELTDSNGNPIATVDIESLFDKKDNLLDNLQKIIKLPFQERIQELKKEKLITDVYQYGNRPVVIVNINGINLPFYRSSAGTGGKTKGKWFPFFGFGKHEKTDTDLTWLIKADTKSNENNFNSDIIKKYSEFINSALNWDHSLDQSMQNPFFNPEITFKGDEEDFNKRIFGEKDRGIINDGGDSILKAYKIIYDIDPKIRFKNSDQSNKRRDYYGNNTSNSESLDRSSKIKESKPLSESEIKWFKSRFPNIELERVKGLIENKAFGRFISSGKVLLSNLAPKNTLRHEAFHVVTQLYLTKDEIVMLYKEVKSKIGDMTDLKAEEILSEDFANYKDNHTILSNRPKRNSLFRKILYFIRALIGLPAKSIEEIYNRIDKGYYTGRKLENIKQFTSLDSLAGLTVTQTKELYDSMDAMFSDIIFKDNKTPSQALSKTDKVLEFIYKRLITKEEQVIASNDQQLIKVYDNILSNWGDVIKGWKERMISLGIPIEDTKESELEYNLDNEEISDEEYSEEHNVRSGDAYKEANEVSTKKTMFTSSKLLIRTLKQKNLDGSDKLNSLGLAQTVEFAPTYNYILKQTVGLSEYNDIYNKLVELSKSRPELVDLTLRLKEPSDSLPLEQIILQRQFRQDFSKNLYDIYITSIQSDGTILQVNSIKQNIQERVRDKWKSNIKLLSKPNNEGKLIVSPKQTKDDIEFLKSIGIEFSKESLPLTKSNKEFTDAVINIRNYIIKNNNDVTDLYTIKKEDKDDKKTKNPINSEIFISNKINYLAGLEAQNNTSVMELSVLSTTNKTIYPVSNNNGLSIIKNIINNSKTLEDLYKALPHLNTVSAENSVWLSKLFDNNGIEIKNKSLQLGLADGVTSEDTSNSTAKLGSTDKFIQEIDQLLKYGNSSVIRTSDKASEHIIGLGKLIIPIEDLAIDPNAKDVTGFNNEKIKSIFRGYFKSELKRIALYELYDIGKNIDEYSKTGGQLTIFSSFPNISEVKEKITDTLKQIRVSVDNGMSNQQVDNLIESLYNSLVPNIENSTYEFLTKYTGELTARLTDYRAIEAISKDLKAQYPLDQLMRTVAVNDFINKTEQTKLMFGDMAFYKALFKRTSSLAGTKETAATDEELNKWLNKDNKRLDGKTANGKVNVAIFEDVTQSKQDLGEYKKSLMSSGLSESEAATLLKPYTKMDEGDAQGWITLDEFREFKIRLGQWSTQLEKVWDKAQKYDKNDSSTHLTKEEINNIFFIVMKTQYAGPTINSKLFVPGFHKFSLLPLIPQLVDGKNMSDILKNMTRQKVGYTLFKSGSKVGTPLVNNKANKFYTESNHGEPNLQDYNIQQIDYKFLGIQTKTSEPHDKVTFGTQLRKLLFNGAFENGEEKIPGARELFNKYTEIIKSQVQEAKDKLIKDLGLDPNNLQAKDVTKLVDLLKSESKSRNLSDNIIDSFQTITDKDGNKTLKYPLDSSVNKDKIDSLIMSLVNSRLIRQKVNGDAYIQVASTGFEELGVRGVGTNRALKFYEKTDKGTSKAEVMIPMSKNYYPLLSKYGSLEALNKAIKTKQIDEKLLTLIGYRIPTQGLNSIDHLIIKEFLPELSGSIIILPTEIVAKSGGDYDIDKMNIFRPDITEEGNLADSSHNKLINIASKMLSHPANFNALITPNSTNILTSAAEDYMYESYKAKGGNKSKDEYFKGQSKKIDYTRQLMLTENVINQHSKLMAAKGGIGPGAINNVFIPLAQSINANINNLINQGTKTERSVVINFPHNITKDGKLDIAKSIDATNTNNIQEVNSQIINAFVDAANSPELLPALNMNMDTLPIYLYLNNIGVPFEYSFWLMKQPIIQEYIKESSINNSSYLAATKAKTVASKLEERLISKYNKNITEDLPTKQYNSSEDLKRLALYNPEESKDTKLNNRYYNQQVQLFEDFLRYKQEAQMMSQAIRSINYDTNGLPSNLEQTRLKVKDYNKAKQEGFVQELDKILNSTPIGAFDQNQFAIDAYSQFYATQSKEEIIDFLDSIYNEIDPIKLEDKNSILKLLTNDFINYVIQNYGYDDISTLKSRLFKGDNSIAKQIASIQADSKNPLNNNLIINELQPIIANEKTSDLKDNLRLYTKRYDSFTANQLTEAFRELKESDPSLYKDIVDLGIIQSGIANSPVTYLGLIPFEYYGDLFNKSFDEFNKKNGVTELNNFKKLFIANNSKDSLIWRTYKPNLSLGDGYYGKDYNNQSIQYSKRSNTIVDKLKASGYISQTHGDLFIKQHFYAQALKFINNLRKEYPNAINIERVQSKLGSKGQGIFRVKIDDQFQKLTSEEKAKTIEQVTKEHRSIAALKDLSAKLAYKIGGKVKFENNPNADWKGYNQGMTSMLNEAYMTPDTPFHEILAHPIIRAIKNRTTYYKTGETAEFHGYGEPYRITIEKIYDDTLEADVIDEQGNKQKVELFELSKTQNTLLYKSLLKELETGRGKEVFEQVKRDYKYKKEKYKTGKILLDDLDFDGDGNPQPSYLEEELERDGIEYTLEEQQEEAIVTLLGLMAADKLDAKKDATLISKLKELWKQISDFVKSLLKQDGIKIDELPITTTLNDLAEIMAYGNNKIILPGYKVEYSTPLGNKYDTLEEVNNEIRGLADTNVEVDLSGVNIYNSNITKDNLPKDFVKTFDIASGSSVFLADNKYNDEFNEKNRLLREKYKDKFVVAPKDKYGLYLDRYNENQVFYNTKEEAEEKALDLSIEEYNKNNQLSGFIEENKKYEQAKKIIEQWMKENNIQYDPEEVYSRGHQFISTMGAFGKVDLKLLFQNMLQHLEDYNRIGAKFELSFHTAPINNRQVVDINQGGGKVYLIAYPQSNDIAWASRRDNYSGSVWEANKKVTDKPSEIAGVAHTKAPSVDNIDTIEPNLAVIIDERNWARNELGIAVTPTNHRVEYDKSVPYEIKKLIDNYNKILDDKYGKLVKPEIKVQSIKYVIKDNINDLVFDTFDTKEEAEKIKNEKNKKFFEDIFYVDVKNIGKQPTQTKENTTSIESVKSKVLSTANRPKSLEELQEGDGFIYFEKDGKYFKEDLSEQIDIEITKEEYEGKKEYTSQALTNLKIAALKEVARKYPRSLITNKVVPINPNIVDNSEIQYSKRESIDKNSNQSNTSTQYSLRETKQLSKPEQLLQRRIDRLTKQVTLEKDTIKKTKLQQQLDYTIEQYSRAQESEDPTPVYREFGKHTLDLAENRINYIKEGNSTDLNADLEYINDVLDVWDDFKGLRDRVAELRESIQELNNQLLVDNINESYNSKNPITLDDIKSQNKDIGTFKYWTGALLDLPNYLAHAIGFIIRTSQNNIERKTNQIYYDIDNKIKEISKSSNKSIQSIYDEIIEYNENFDTKSLIKEDKLDSVSKEAQEFYHFYQSKMEELIEITPTLTRRNSKGELETFNLNKYFIPNVPKNSFKNTLKNFNPVKERSIGNTIKDEEQKADIISLDYIKKIPSKDKSDDLGNSLFLFAKDIYNYDEMSKILPKVRLIQREIEKTSYIQGSNPNYTKTGKDSNLYKITEAFIKAQIKGEYKEEQGRSITWGTKTDEKGNTTEKYLDITGTIDNLLKWNSLLRIGLSPVGASANIGFGKLSNFMEAIGGRFFNRTHLRQAERIFWAQTFKEDSVLNKELLSKYNILQELTDYEQSENLKTGKYKKLSSEKLIELMYAPQKYGEKWIQSSTLLAIMIHDGYLSPEGELTDKFNNASNKEKEQLFGKITGINNKLHGRYSAKEAAALQQNVIYRAISQFRKWIPAAIEARFDKKHYDPRLGVEVEGRYNTLGRKVLLELAKGDITNAFYNLFMPLINAKEALESGKLTESDIYNMRKMLIESVLAIATLVLYSIGTGDDPEDKKRRKEAWFKSTMLLLNRVSGDLTFFYSPNQINNLTKNAIPMSKLVDDLLKIGPEIPNAFDSKKNKFKSGNSKGQYKLPKRIISVIPGSKAPYDLIKIFNKQALDEVK